MKYDEVWRSECLKKHKQMAPWAQVQAQRGSNAGVPPSRRLPQTLCQYILESESDKTKHQISLKQSKVLKNT